MSPNLRGPTGGAGALAQVRDRVPPPAPTVPQPCGPKATREAMMDRLAWVRAEQTKLFRASRSGGLSPKDHLRGVDLGREELELMKRVKEGAPSRAGRNNRRRSTAAMSAA